MQQMNTRTDPAPSRWSYRIQRILLTPFYRKLFKIGAPILLVALILGIIFGAQSRREAIYAMIESVREEVRNRPEFMIKAIEIEGASDQLDQAIRGRFPYDLPVSSFDLELDSFRIAVEGIPAVADASLRVQRGGVLSIKVDERTAVALWRSREGLWALDDEGVSIAAMRSRMDAPGLPVFAGKGADKAVPEALMILEAASPLKARIRGLERRGERRWDVVLDQEQRIMLPETESVRALERVIVMSETHDLFEKDVVSVDMRLPERPTVRMHERAVQAWREVAGLSVGAVKQ